MFDATPDIAHREQISEIIRTVKISKDGCCIEENFIRLICFDGKTGEQLTKMIVDTLKKDDLDIGMCRKPAPDLGNCTFRIWRPGQLPRLPFPISGPGRGQGYDNGSNMAGMYKGVQALPSLKNSVVYPRLCSSWLNVCPEVNAQTCADADCLRIQRSTPRFQTLQVASDFSFLWGHKLETYLSEEMKKNVMDLVQSYENDFVGETFLLEVEHLKSEISAFLDKPLQKTMPLDILNGLTADGLQEQCINCHKALRIFLTLPVTVVTNERSFSKLKIINNYLRSSMGQERLTDLSIIFIEHNYVKDMSFNNIIDDFAVAKCRNVQF
ncbi:Zinc finger MYM-type protein 1 [Folsomia candida]|uniref:Zinc finger MYM-type protein 1 n=1 Tax=Folsomia candida TaxID=158441 RepID=A0A226ED04_FOLCA|nr:Zinc finger MYM-type protein 1 [Folsomia candida]